MEFESISRVQGGFHAEQTFKVDIKLNVNQECKGRVEHFRKKGHHRLSFGIKNKHGAF